MKIKTMKNNHKMCCRVKSVEQMVNIRKAVYPLPSFSSNYQNVSKLYAVFFKFCGPPEVYFYRNVTGLGVRMVEYDYFLKAVKDSVKKIKRIPKDYKYWS